MRRWIIAAVVGVGLSAGVWAWTHRPARPPSPAVIDLYFTCDTSGRLEPCGCFMGQFGGLTRVSTVLQKAPPGALKFEVGDAIAGTEDYHVIQYRHMLRAYAQMGYTAVNLGKREARLSSATLRDLAKSSPVPLLGANIVDSLTGGGIVRPWIVVERPGAHIGVVGVVDPARLDGPADPSVRVADMAATLRRVVPEMKKQSDVLVCLAFTDEAGLEKLARDFYEFQIILGGDVRQPSKGATHLNQSWLIATTNQARALGELHTRFDSATRTLENVTGDITLMEDTIPQDAALIAMSRDYRREVRNTPLAADQPAAGAADRVPGVVASASFAGSESCAACHAAAFTAWSKSRHAHAFDALVAKDSDADPNCIACHAIGFGELGGYQRSMKNERLVHVGCESCHGPASEHVKLRSAAAANPAQPVLLKMRPVGAGQCSQCHHGEFSRPFKWEEFWPLIEHGAAKRGE